MAFSTSDALLVSGNVFKKINFLLTKQARYPLNAQVIDQLLLKPVGLFLLEITNENIEEEIS